MSDIDATSKSRVDPGSRDGRTEVESIDTEASKRLVDEVVKLCTRESIPYHDIAVILMVMSKEFFDCGEFYRAHDEFPKLAERIEGLSETAVSEVAEG